MNLRPLDTSDGPVTSDDNFVTVRWDKTLRLGKVSRLALACVMLATLAGCADNLDTSVTRFHAQLPPPAGQTFVVLPDEQSNNGGLEFGMYAADVAKHMGQLGYMPAASVDTASMVVHLGYNVDNGQQQIESDPGWGGPYGGWGGPYGGWGWGGGWGGGYGGFGWGGGWGGPGWGWGDDGGMLDSTTIYTSNLTMRIDGHSSNQRLFEGRAQAVSDSNHLQALVPDLIEAMFTGFPGNSGQTLHITVAPEHHP